MRHISKDAVIQNHINFYLVLGEDFVKHKEDDDFDHHWSIDEKASKEVQGSLKKLHDSIGDEELVKEEEIVERFMGQLGSILDEYKNNKETIFRYLSLSKKIGKNQLHEWGRTSSPHVRARGIKDYAYLIMRRENRPMHFREVATAINTTFGKRAHVATCHNELIKDPRFVLVGRGMYGLKEWGHTGGVVKDVIKEVLKDKGTPMSKEAIVEGVLSRRMVRPNTVIVNLQNVKFFKKNKDGLYELAK
jgi:hypothetical protein